MDWRFGARIGSRCATSHDVPNWSQTAASTNKAHVPPFKGVERKLRLTKLFLQTLVNKRAIRDDQRTIRQLLSELVEQSAQRLSQLIKDHSAGAR
jgi:hypothetical protein